MLLPLASIESGVATRVKPLLPAAGAPAVKVTSAEFFAEPAAASTVTAPATFELVSTMLAAPEASVIEVGLASEPAVVVQVTTTPVPTELPLASFTVAVRVETLTPSASIASGVATRVRPLLPAAGAPAVKATTAVSRAAPAAASTVTAPATVELVSTMLAAPKASVIEVVLASVPSVVVQVTTTPVPTELPLASVRFEVLLPLASIESGVATRVRPLLPAAGAPAAKVTSVVSWAAPAAASTVTAPAVFELVSTALATPLLFVTDDRTSSVPPVVAQLTTTPAPTALPLASLIAAVRVEALLPFASIEAGVAANDKPLLPAAGAPAVKVTTALSFAAPAAASTVTEPAAFELVSTTLAAPKASVIEVGLDNEPSVVFQVTATRCHWHPGPWR